MEIREKISFLEKLKISIFKLEEYEKLAAQKVGKTIVYALIIMIIFALCVSGAVTYNFKQALDQVKDYIYSEVDTITFQDGTLNIVPSNEKDKPIIIENEELPVGKIIIDTRDISEEELENYNEQIKKYTSGIVILKDKIVTKDEMSTITNTMTYKDIVEQYGIPNFQKDDILNMLSDNSALTICSMFYFGTAIYLFIIYFSTLLIDAIFLAVLAYITSAIARIRLKPSASYNIAVHSLTLPVILNLIYIIANILTGFKIEYFQVVYTTIASIYVIATVFIIRSDVIKKQVELNKIIAEQEKVRQELENKKQEEQEKADREKQRKEEEKKRKQEQEENKTGENKKEDEKGESTNGKSGLNGNNENKDGGEPVEL